jgi:hypothetical protein
LNISLASVPAALKQHEWIQIQDIGTLPFPKIINEYLQAINAEGALY